MTGTGTGAGTGAQAWIGSRRYAPGTGSGMSEAIGTGWTNGWIKDQWGTAEEEMGACEATAKLIMN